MKNNRERATSSGRWGRGRLKAKGEDAKGGGPACLPGIDVSLDVSFSEEPVRRDDGSEEEDARASTPLPLLRVIPARGTTMLSHRLLHRRRSCVSRAHTGEHTATITQRCLGISVEWEKDGEGLTPHSQSESARNRVRCWRGVLRRRSRRLGEIDKRVKEVSPWEIARFSK